MIRPVTLVTLLAAMGAGLHLYQTKHAVALLDRELRGIGRQIGTAQERTVALAAEWAWLNEPERLRAVAQRHLQLEPMQPTQFVRLGEAERRLTEAERRLPAAAGALPVALAATDARRDVVLVAAPPGPSGTVPPGSRAEFAPLARAEAAPAARGDIAFAARHDAAANDAATLRRGDAGAPAAAGRSEPPLPTRREPAASAAALAPPPRPAARLATGPQRPPASTVALLPAAAMQSGLLPGIAHAATSSALGGSDAALPPPVPFAR